MQCPECKSTHIRKNGTQREVNKTTFVLIVDDNSSKIMRHLEATVMKSNENA